MVCQRLAVLLEFAHIKLQRCQNMIRTTYFIAFETAHAQNGACGKVPRRLSGQSGLFLRPWLFGVSSHLIKPGGVRRGCALVNVRVTPLGGQEAIKMVRSCCVFGCPNRVAKPPGTRHCRFPTFPDSRRQEQIQVIKGKHRTPPIKTRIDGSYFVAGKVFALLLVMNGSVPDCCIILGKPDDRVNHIHYATTLFAFTWPVDKAQKARTLADQEFDFAN